MMRRSMRHARTNVAARNRPCGPIAVWLVPSRDGLAYCKRLVSRLAARYRAPVFLPHVTIYTAEQVDRRKLVEALSDVATIINRVQLRVEGVEHSHDRFYTLVLRLEDEAALRWIRRQLESRLGQQTRSVHPPHVSLLYQELGKHARVALAEEIRASGPPAQLTFDAFAMVQPRKGDWQDISHWRQELIPPPHRNSIDALLAMNGRLGAAAIRDSASRLNVGRRSLWTHAFSVGTDPRRDGNPLNQEPGCVFCQCFKHPPAGSCRIRGVDIQIDLRPDSIFGSKFLIYNGIRGPTPDLDSTRGLYRFLERAAERNIPMIGICNLPGSGASVPGHFHWQAFPRVLGSKPTAISSLLKNLPIGAIRARHRRQIEGVSVSQTEHPVPGWRFEFPAAWRANQCANWLQDVVFDRVLHGYYAGLSVNLYLWREDERHRGIALWRNPKNEAHTKSASWRWGWMEMIGYIPVRTREGAEAYANGRWLPTARRCGVPSCHVERLFLAAMRPL